jgi:hypothetical protein
LDYNGFRHAYGGGFADRVRLARAPDCATECGPPDQVPADNDTGHGTLTATVPTGAVYMLVTAAAGDSGDYRATDLNPSGKWQAGSGSGEFTYSYPFTLPTPPYGSAPNLALRYSPGSVDGRTSASNNQASLVGLGWDLNPGFIERRYRNCVDDGQTLLSDLCWHSPYSGDEDGAAYVISVDGSRRASRYWTPRSPRPAWISWWASEAAGVSLVSGRGDGRRRRGWRGGAGG